MNSNHEQQFIHLMQRCGTNIIGYDEGKPHIFIDSILENTPDLPAAMEHAKWIRDNYDHCCKLVAGIWGLT